MLPFWQESQRLAEAPCRAGGIYMSQSLLRPKGRWLALAAIASLSVGLAACGGSSPAPSGNGAVKSGGSVTFALDEDVADFNVLQANDREFVLQEILDQTLPQIFI